MNIYPYKKIIRDHIFSPQDKLRCTACGLLTSIEISGNGPNNGLHLTGFAGYYGGFTDRLISQSDEQDTDSDDDAWFCHKCCVKLYATFPHLSKAVHMADTTGNHSCNTDIPCCKYCYKIVQNPTQDDEYIISVPVHNHVSGKLEWYLTAVNNI